MSTPDTVPIVLLKSPSPTPSQDAYTKHLTAKYTPHFVPVLKHTLLPDPLIKLLLTQLTSSTSKSQLRPPFPYGALILTSQRAVAALNSALSSPAVQEKIDPIRLQELKLKLYTVGPATADALRPIRDRWLRNCDIYGGEEAGNGEVLGRIILGEGEGDASAAQYATDVGTDIAEEEEEKVVIKDNNDGSKENESDKKRRRTTTQRKPILFLAGETRRDTIPKMLQSPSLPEAQRVKVDEMVIYQSSELEEFEFAFSQALAQTERERKPAVRWIVVFSPTAGKGMLRCLGWLDGCGSAAGTVNREAVKASRKNGRGDFVCCIGPTTVGYLEREFGFQADVVAERPSPEGVREGIEAFMKGRGWEGRC